MSDQFFVRRNGKESGPYAIEEIAKAYGSAAFRESAELRLETGRDWFPIAKLNSRLVALANQTVEPPSQPNSTVSAPIEPVRKAATSKATKVDTGQDFGRLITKYAAFGRLLGVLSLLFSLIGGVIVMGTSPSLIVPGIGMIASGVLSCFVLFVSSEMLTAIVLVVRNTAHMRESLESMKRDQ